MIENTQKMKVSNGQIDSLKLECTKYELTTKELAALPQELDSMNQQEDCKLVSVARVHIMLVGGDATISRCLECIACCFFFTQM